MTEGRAVVPLHGDVPEPTVLSHEEETNGERWVHSDGRLFACAGHRMGEVERGTPLVDL
ncbi:MAG: hypothetical protein ACETV0_06070 [Nitrososphaeria archaeon]